MAGKYSRLGIAAAAALVAVSPLTTLIGSQNDRKTGKRFADSFNSTGSVSPTPDQLKAAVERQVARLRRQSGLPERDWPFTVEDAVNGVARQRQLKELGAEVSASVHTGNSFDDQAETRDSALIANGARSKWRFTTSDEVKLGFQQANATVLAQECSTAETTGTVGDVFGCVDNSLRTQSHIGLAQTGGDQVITDLNARCGKALSDYRANQRAAAKDFYGCLEVHTGPNTLDRTLSQLIVDAHIPASVDSAAYLGL